MVVILFFLHLLLTHESPQALASEKKASSVQFILPNHFQCPEEKARYQGQPLSKNDVLIFGDLHGNATSIVITLYYFRLLNIKEDQCTKLLTLYYDPLIPIIDGATPYYYHKKEQDEAFEQWLEKEIQGNNINSQFPSLLFLGDILADRGRSDYWTLLLFNKLFDLLSTAPIHILISNHDLAFLQYYNEQFDDEARKLGKPIPELEIKRDLHSLQSIEKYRMDQGVKGKIKKIIEKYKEHLHLTQTMIVENKKIIATHAPLQKDISKENWRNIEAHFQEIKQGHSVDKKNISYKKDSLVGSFVNTRYNTSKTENPSPGVIFLHGHDNHPVLKNGGRPDEDTDILTLEHARVVLNGDGGREDVLSNFRDLEHKPEMTIQKASDWDRQGVQGQKSRTYTFVILRGVTTISHELPYIRKN